jgi:hypothetical protein
MKVTAALKPLNPRSPDTKYVGLEPAWRNQPTEGRISALSTAFGWYNYFYGKKEAKDFVVAYLDLHSKVKEAQQIRTLPDSQMRLTTGWLCRMSMMGLQLSDHEQIQLDNLIAELVAIKQEMQAEAEVSDDEPARPNIQDRLREKVSECSAELEAMFDEFMTAGARMSADFKPIMVIRGMNVAPQMISVISHHWKARLEEFEQAIEGKDSQLVEAYNFLTKIQLRNCVKFCEAVVNDCGAYVQIKKVERKPRKVKSVPPEKRAAKFKIQAEFAELKLKSLPAASLVDRAEAWLYDTKKRKLIHLVADSHTQAFTVKNNSIIGFSTVETQQKTLRKPADVVKAVQAAGKPAARKLYKDIKATETAWNGRGTENLIILKSW